MSKDLVMELKKLEHYSIEMEKDYVIATPELLTNPEAEAYLAEELKCVAIRAVPIATITRTLKNIITNAKSHLLCKSGLPVSKIQQTLFNAGYKVKMIRMCASKKPMAVAIETKMGLIVVQMDIPMLNTATDILNWGIPETEGS